MVKKLLNGHSKKMLLGFCIYKVVIDFFCIFFPELFPGLSRLGLDISFYNYMLSWLCFFIVIYLYVSLIFDSDRLKKSFSQQIVLFLLLLSVIPFFSMYGAGAISDKCCIYYNVFLYVLLIVWICINHFFYKQKTINRTNTFYGLSISRWKKYVFVTVGFVTATSIVAIFCCSAGVSAFAVGSNIYEQRAMFRQIMNEMPGILVYFISFANIIEILMLVYCLQIKKYLYAVFWMGVCYMHFSLGADKTIFLSVIMSLVLYVVVAKITMIRIIAFQVGLIVICALLSFFDIVFYITSYEQSDFWLAVNSLGSSLPADLFRRLVFEPAYLQNAYVTFFAERAPNYWGLNTDYSVGLGLENYMSDVYCNSPLGFANTGLVGDCFANMGEYGVIVYPIVLAAILFCFDFAFRGKDARIFMGLSLLFVVFLINGMLTTVMLTHGGFVMILMLWCFPYGSDDCEQNNGSTQLNT